MQVVIVAFDDFTDLDVFLHWDMMTRVPYLYPERTDWRVRLLGTEDTHTSMGGLTIPMHGTIEEAVDADAVIISSGKGTRRLIEDKAYLARLGAALSPQRQRIGSQCSGALILAALGLLDGKTATTYPTAKETLESFGVTVVEEPFVRHGNVATAGGCLAGLELSGWILEELAGAEVRDAVLNSAAPVGARLEIAPYRASSPTVEARGPGVGKDRAASWDGDGLGAAGQHRAKVGA